MTTEVWADLGQRLDRIDDLSIAVVGGCQVVESSVGFVSDEDLSRHPIAPCGTSIVFANLWDRD